MMTITVMTGGTSGIGAVAAEIIGKKSGSRLIQGVRNPKAGSPDQIALDLADLKKVQSFTDGVTKAIGAAKIDALVLNAGVNMPGNERRTVDGYEIHFGVNHLAHYLILRNLLPYLAKGARVVITTADAHDPELFKMAPPETADAVVMAHPPAPAPGSKDGAFKLGFRAYAHSKLANILTSLALARQPEATAQGISSIAFNPSFTPDTAIGRHAPLPLRILLKTLVPIVKIFVPINTSKLAGQAVADLALGKVVPPQGRHYASLVKKKLTWPNPGGFAVDQQAQDAMWRDSADMLDNTLGARA